MEEGKMVRTNGRTSLGVLCTSAILVVSASGRPNEPAGGLSLETARSLIAEVGAQEAAERVSSDSAMLEPVAAGVAGASEGWLDVGVQLFGPAEGYLEDRLLQSFNYALQHNATAVLARGASGVPVEAVCGYDPFAALDDPPKRPEFHQAVTVRERAVSNVKRPDLAGAKATCLAALAHLRTVGANRYER
jgi:hypothetical protein